MKPLVKICIIFMLILLLWIPLLLVGGLSSERESYKYQVTEEIAASYGPNQIVSMPYLIISIDSYHEVTYDNITSLETDTHTFLLPPVRASLEGDVQVEQKSRGIYSLNVFNSKLNMRGSFAPDEKLMEYINMDNTHIADIVFAFAVNNTKGFNALPVAMVDGKSVSFDRVRDSGSVQLFGKVKPSTWNFDFELSLDLSGSSEIAIATTASQTDIYLESNWPHPKFYGDMLPESHEITDKGFTAFWKTTGLSGQYFSGGLSSFSSGYIYDLMNFHADTSFVDVIDIYSLVDRSVKYGIIIIALTFMVLFVVENLAKVRVHILQYIMTGSALVVFFLLLLALSEHIAFGLSYLVGAFACVALITFYLYYTLKSFKSTAIFSFALVLLYAVLYLLLNMGDYALLFGSVLIFAILALVMIFTRKLNWYEISQ